MKTYAASVGLLAVSTSVLSAVDANVLNSQQSSKPWSVSASLRGFYDSNINSAPSGQTVDSYGFQVNPTLNYGFVGERTSVNFGYDLAANYYDNRPAGQSDHWDLTHTILAALSHTFNPRIDMVVKDSFVIGQEPDVLQVANTPFATSQRLSGDNQRNYGLINLNLQATSLLGFQVGYGNTYYNYADSGPLSNSALLDRLEHAVHLDSRWTIQPETVGILGYMYSQVDYTGNQIIGYVLPAITPVYSDSRNARGNTIYAGAEHSFTPDISGSLKAGVQIFDYYNDPSSSTKTSPYVQGSLRYVYRATSHVEGGVALMRSPTDAFNSTGTSYVLDAESLVLYGAWVHEILPRLYSNVNGSFQQSRFNGGSLDGENDMFYRLGLSLAYEINKYTSASVGYNWDQSDSNDISRTYNRNRVFIGLTAAY